MGPIRTATLLTAAIITAAALALATPAQAAYSITSLNTPVIESFTDYDGNAAPANWTMTGNTGPLYQGQGTGSGTAGGIWSYGAASSSERALGYLANSSTAQSVELTAAFENNTGGVLVQLDVSFRAEQWRLTGDGRISGWEVSLSTDGVLFTVVNDLSTWTATNSGTTGAVDGNSVTYGETLSANITGLSIGDGATFYLRFSADRGSGGGASQGIAIDDLSVTAIPEPASLALMGLGGLVLMVRRHGI